MGTGARIRVSCTALARITDDAGNLALYTSRKGDRTILRPLGGSLQSGPRSRDQLSRRFGAAQFEEEPDLRFTVPISQVDNVVTWFGTGQSRETGVLRGLYELLIDRTRIINAGEARQLTQVLRGRAKHNGTSPRNVPVQETLYLIEVFDVGVPSAILAKLKASPRIFFVSQEEIRRDSRPGGRISSMAPFLLLGA